MNLLLPAALPDMTLYAMLSMVEKLNGKSRAEEVSQILFGTRTAGLLHDFSSHLGEFCQRTDYVYGNPEAVALHYTLLPYFLGFQGNDIRLKALELMRGTSVERLKFVLGLPAGPSRASLPLHYCKACADTDLQNFGVSYWHRSHQVPGVSVCPDHGTPLSISTRRIDGIGRSRLFLPLDSEIVASSRQVELGNGREILLRLARLAQWILDPHFPGYTSPELLHFAYLHGLKQNGMLTRCGKVRAVEFLNWLCKRYASIASFEPFNRIVAPANVTGMLKLVRKPNRHFHTLRHLILIDALFGNWELFESVYGWERQMLLPLVAEVNSPCIPEATGNKALAMELARRYNLGQGSVSSIARQLGLDVSSAMRWLGKLGLIDTPKRPRMLHAELRSKICDALRQGCPLVEIVKTYGISRSTLDRICHENPKLYQEWQCTAHENKKQVERKKLEAFLQVNPSASRMAIRQATGSGYIWLSKHDAQWLSSQLPKPSKPLPSKSRSTRRQRVDWDARDNECLWALQSYGGSLTFGNHERRKPMVVIRKLPKMSFVPRLDHLPKSKAWIQLYLSRRKRAAGY